MGFVPNNSANSAYADRAFLLVRTFETLLTANLTRVGPTELFPRESISQRRS
jgi:hypothetical protein